MNRITIINPFTLEPAFDRPAAEGQLELIREAEADGARLCQGGVGERIGRIDFLQPTLLADVAPAMRVRQEETFGQRCSGNGSLALSPEGLRAFSARRSVNVDPSGLQA